VAWEARTGPRQTQTCIDTPATSRLRRGRLLTTLQPTKRQPATVGAVERGGRVTKARSQLISSLYYNDDDAFYLFTCTTVA
jgi:hypothetical protein